MSKPTRVEKETLLALLELGRRTTHTLRAITLKRLQMRHGWESAEWWPSRIRNNERGQYLRATEKWLYSFAYRGLVIVKHDQVKAGKRLNLSFGPFFKLSPEGHKRAEELRRG